MVELIPGTHHVRGAQRQYARGYTCPAPGDAIEVAIVGTPRRRVQTRSPPRKAIAQDVVPFVRMPSAAARLAALAVMM